METKGIQGQARLVWPEAVALGAASELGRALHASGAAAPRIEEAVRHSVAAWGHPIEVLYSSTALLLGSPERGRCVLARLEPGDHDLARLCELHTLVRRIEDEALSPEETLEALRTPRPGVDAQSLREALAFVASALGASVLLGGSPQERPVVVAVAAAVALVLHLCGRWELPQLASGGAGLVAALVVGAASRLPVVAMDGVIEQRVVLSALIVLLPGLSLTVAMAELASGHLVTGVARTAAAAVKLGAMVLGLALGRAALGPELVDGVLPSVHGGNEVALWAAAVASPWAFAVLLRAPREEFGWIWVGALSAFFAARAVGAVHGPALAALAGSFVVGSLAALRSRMAGTPAALINLPGLLLLVPGSLGFEGVSGLAAHDIARGVQGLFDAAWIAGSLAAGLVAAAATVDQIGPSMMARLLRSGRAAWPCLRARERALPAVGAALPLRWSRRLGVVRRRALGSEPR